MRIEFVDRSDILTEKNEEHARRSLLFALSRFGDEIETVRVTAFDTNGPKGGVDIQCLAQVHLRRLGTLEVKQVCANFGSGVPHLARRLGRVVARRLKTKRRFTRDSIRKHEWPLETAS